MPYTDASGRRQYRLAAKITAERANPRHNAYVSLLQPVPASLLTDNPEHLRLRGGCSRLPGDVRSRNFRRDAARVIDASQTR